jgi:hypothetical protein
MPKENTVYFEDGIGIKHKLFWPENIHQKLSIFFTYKRVLYIAV